jgi:hypothetical protein
VNINGIMKLLLIKTSVGLFTLLGVVEEFVAKFGGYTSSFDNQGYSTAIATQRAYCNYLLITYLII